MPLDPTLIALGVLGIGFVSLIFRDIVRSPKEASAERRANEDRRQQLLEQRLQMLEQNHTSTAVEQAKMTTAVNNLTEAVKELRIEFRDMRLMGNTGNAQSTG